MGADQSRELGGGSRFDGEGEGVGVSSPDGRDEGDNGQARTPEKYAGGGDALPNTHAYTGAMRSTAAYTGAGGRGRDTSGGEPASQGLWRSYYAQQREREVAFNSGAYRRDHMRDTAGYGSFDRVVMDSERNPGGDRGDGGRRVNAQEAQHEGGQPEQHHNTYDYRDRVTQHMRQLSLNN